MTEQQPPARPQAIAAAAVIAGGIGIAYWSVLEKLVHDWSVNDNYSHGFLIAPIAGYLVWERRARIAATPVRPSWVGLAIVLAGLVTLAGGVLGVELFLTRISLILVLAGIVVFMAGWRHLRIVSFPIAFLLLMIPIPMIIFNEIAFPLQLLASRFGETALWALHIPVLRQGNIITLANTSLEVAEACSGIRSLVSLLTLNILYAYFSEPRRSVQLLLVALTVPIAILTNGLRVAAIGIAASNYGRQSAEGAFHTVSGWLVFVAAMGLIVLVHRVIRFFLSSSTPKLPGIAADATPSVSRGQC